MRIRAVGLEVEGGWDGEPGVPPFDDLLLTSDHSVDGRMQPPDKVLQSVHVGEAVSPPLEPLPRVYKDWINKHWPTETNITCGYHIHLSFDKIKDYSLLTTKTFLYHLNARMEELGQELKLPPEHYLWRRLAGVSQFAKLQYDTAKQLGLRQKRVGDPVRYGFLNHCFKLHGTVEFRALPTFETPELAIAFTENYLDFTEEFLDKNQDSMKLTHAVSLYYSPAGPRVISL